MFEPVLLGEPAIAFIHTPGIVIVVLIGVLGRQLVTPSAQTRERMSVIAAVVVRVLRSSSPISSSTAYGDYVCILN